MTLDYNVYAILVAAALVFVLSVIGSLIAYLQATDESCLEETKSQGLRWKWMVVVFMIILTIMLLNKPA